MVCSLGSVAHPGLFWSSAVANCGGTISIVAIILLCATPFMSAATAPAMNVFALRGDTYPSCVRQCAVPGWACGRALPFLGQTPHCVVVVTRLFCEGLQGGGVAFLGGHNHGIKAALFDASCARAETMPLIVSLPGGAMFVARPGWMLFVGCSSCQHVCVLHKHIGFTASQSLRAGSFQLTRTLLVLGGLVQDREGGAEDCSMPIAACSLGLFMLLLAASNSWQ